MTIKKAAYFLLISLFFLSATVAVASEAETRYLVKTHSNFWKKSFNARHTFDAGFTADLNEWQLKLAKVFGVEVELVKRLNILPGAIAAPRKAKTVVRTPTEQVPWGVNMMYGGSTSAVPNGGLDINIAVLDTGVSKNHPDLKNRIKDCKDFSSPASGMVDGRCDDKNGHGTHVAGILAADGGPEGKGIYGLVPEANLFAYKVCLNNGTCYSDDVAAAIRTAAEAKAQIVNLSLGGDTLSPLIEEAVNFASDKGTLVVAAAGNDGPYVRSIDYPAALSAVVSVGALDSDGVIPDWSSRGSNKDSEPYVRELGDIEFAAPGVNIESTGISGDYVVLSGSSMAAPHVAGLAAKLWQADAENPAAATRTLLTEFAKDVFPLGDDNGSGWGVPTL